MGAKIWNVSFLDGDLYIPGLNFDSRGGVEEFLLRNGYTEKVKDDGASFNAFRVSLVYTKGGRQDINFGDKELRILAMVRSDGYSESSEELPKYCLSTKLDSVLENVHSYYQYEGLKLEYFEEHGTCF